MVSATAFFVYLPSFKVSFVCKSQLKTLGTKQGTQLRYLFGYSENWFIKVTQKEFLKSSIIQGINNKNYTKSIWFKCNSNKLTLYTRFYCSWKCLERTRWNTFYNIKKVVLFIKLVTSQLLVRNYGNILEVLVTSLPSSHVIEKYDRYT